MHLALGQYVYLCLLTHLLFVCIVVIGECKKKKKQLQDVLWKIRDSTFKTYRTTFSSIFIWTNIFSNFAFPNRIFLIK